MIGRAGFRAVTIIAFAVLAAVSTHAPAFGAEASESIAASQPVPHNIHFISPSVDRILAEQATIRDSAHLTPQASPPGDDLRGISMTAVPLPRATIMGAAMLILMAVVAMVRQSRRRNASLD